MQFPRGRVLQGERIRATPGVVRALSLPSAAAPEIRFGGTTTPSAAAGSITAMTSSKPAPWRTPLLTVHIVTSVGAIGAILVQLALGIAGARGADPRTVYPAALLVEVWVIAPLAVLALGTGLALALWSRWGLARYWWVAIKLTITAVLTVVVFLVLVPSLAATAAAESLTDAQRTRLALFPAVALALLVVNVVLGLTKPRWRLRPEHKSDPLPARDPVPGR
jgi:hypothetical protein